MKSSYCEQINAIWIQILFTYCWMCTESMLKLSHQNGVEWNVASWWCGWFFGFSVSSCYSFGYLYGKFGFSTVCSKCKWESSKKMKSRETNKHHWFSHNTLCKMFLYQYIYVRPMARFVCCAFVYCTKFTDSSHRAQRKRGILKHKYTRIHEGFSYQKFIPLLVPLYLTHEILRWYQLGKTHRFAPHSTARHGSQRSNAALFVDSLLR